MILRLSSSILAATGLGLLSTSSLVGAQQLKRAASLNRQQQKDGQDLPSNSRLLNHRRKKAQQKKKQLSGSTRKRKLQSSQCQRIIAIDSISEAMSDADEENDEDFLCELAHGVTLPIQGTDEQINQMRALLHDGTLISYESTLEVMQEVEMIDSMAGGDDDDSGELQPALSPLLQSSSVFLPPGDVNVINTPSDDGRKLNAGYKIQFEGKSPVLVVKITDKDGLSVDGDADFISNKVFGTNGDKINPAQGFKDCSGGRLELTYEYSVDIEDKLSAPGVVEVDIPISLKTSHQAEIRAAAQQAVEEKLELQLPGPFQHVMLLTENCYPNDKYKNCGWAAYAFLRGWMSLYKRDHYLKPAVVEHEFGHNFGLAHSGGPDGRVYSDHTGLMGNPLWDDDLGKMCFNAPKNFQLAVGNNAWYNDGPGEIITWDSGDEGGTVLETTMVGIAEFDKITDNNPVVVKLETGEKLDYYVGFNRATGANSQNRLASDLVTIYETGNDGLSYSNSFLKAYLAEGESYTIPKWRGTNLDLTIKVLEINIKEVPGYARIKIVFGDEPKPPPPTPKPTAGPPTPPQPTAPSGGSVCGDGICDMDESPEDCAEDCIIVDFKPNNGKSNAKTNGLMFSLDAKKPLTLTSLDVESKKDGDSQVTVYALKDDYEGNEFNEEAWELVFDHSVSLQKNVATNIGKFDKEVAIQAGERVSLFVFSKNGLLMSTNTGTLRAAEDESLIMYNGLAFKNAFKKVDQNGQWNSAVKYYGSSKHMKVEEMRTSTASEEEEEEVQSQEEEAASVEKKKTSRSSRSSDDVVVTAVKHHHHHAK